MKKIKTRNLGNAKIELHSDGKMYIIFFKFKEYTEEILKSSFMSILTEYFDSIKVSKETNDIVQFYYSHDDDYFVFHEFNYISGLFNKMNINLRTFTKEVQEEYLLISLDEVNRIYGKDANQFIANSIFNSITHGT